VLYRSWLLSLVGGCLVGVVAGCGVALTDDDLDSTAGTVIVGVGFLGGLAGIVLGVVLGVVVALIAGASLVPYPGRSKAVGTVRLAAVLSVGALVTWAGATAFASGWVAVVTSVTAMALAGVLSPWVINWYVAEVEAPARAGAPDLRTD
jgi:hypothetical protein